MICPHGHPSLHSWSPLNHPYLYILMICPHGHPSLHSWSLFTHDHPTLYSWSPTVVTLLSTHGHLLRIHGHPSPHSWPPFSALMVTLLCTHGHPSLHSWSHFSALMVTLLFTHGHPSLDSWSPMGARSGLQERGGEGGRTLLIGDLTCNYNNIYFECYFHFVHRCFV